MATYQYQYAAVGPIAMSTKSAHAYSYAPVSRQYAASPPESTASVTSSGASYSIASGYTASTYAPSEYSTASPNIDLQDFVSERFEQLSVDPLPMDRSLARQAQASGKLNNKQREVEELRAKAQARLAKSRARMQTGMRDAQEVKRDLEWSQKHVSRLTNKTAKKHPKEFAQARQRYPSPDYES